MGTQKKKKKKKLWKSKTLQTKLRIFNPNAKLVFDVWVRDLGCVTKLQVYVYKCLRRIMRIGWTDRARKEEGWKRTGQAPVGDEIGKRR